MDGVLSGDRRRRSRVQRVHRDWRAAERGRGPSVVHVRPQGPVDVDRHGVLVVAGRRALGLWRPSQRRVLGRDRVRSGHAPVGLHDCDVQARRYARGGRPLQGSRQHRGRLRALRVVRHAAPPALRVPRGRLFGRAGVLDVREPGRPLELFDCAERSVAAAGDAFGPAFRRLRGRLAAQPADARHGHVSGRPDRDWRRVRGARLRRRRRGVGGPAPRGRQVVLRALRARGRRDGHDPDAVGTVAAHERADHASAQPERARGERVRARGQPAGGSASVCDVVHGRHRRRSSLLQLRRELFRVPGHERLRGPRRRGCRRRSLARRAQLREQGLAHGAVLVRADRGCAVRFCSGGRFSGAVDRGGAPVAGPPVVPVGPQGERSGHLPRCGLPGDERGVGRPPRARRQQRRFAHRAGRVLHQPAAGAPRGRAQHAPVPSRLVERPVHGVESVGRAVAVVAAHVGVRLLLGRLSARRGRRRPGGRERHGGARQGAPVRGADRLSHAPVRARRRAAAGRGVDDELR